MYFMGLSLNAMGKRVTLGKKPDVGILSYLTACNSITNRNMSNVFKIDQELERETWGREVYFKVKIRA